MVENTTPDYAAGLVSAQVLVYFSLNCTGSFCFTILFMIFKRFQKCIGDLKAPRLLFFPPLSETGGVEREPSAINQLPTSHTQHGSLLLLHSQLRGATRLDQTSVWFICLGSNSVPASRTRYNAYIQSLVQQTK